MALTNIDPSTFNVPAGLVLLYINSGSIYQKNSNGITSTLTSATRVLKVLGVNAADLPCLVYAADLSHAITAAEELITSDLTGVVVGSSAKAENVYASRLAYRKVDKHVFLNEIQSLKSMIGSVLRVVDTMPAASEYAGHTVLYSGVTTENYTNARMYQSDGSVWVDVTPGFEEINHAISLASSAFGVADALADRVEQLEAQVATIMTQLGLE